MGYGSSAHAFGCNLCHFDRWGLSVITKLRREGLKRAFPSENLGRQDILAGSEFRKVFDTIAGSDLIYVAAG